MRRLALLLAALPLLAFAQYAAQPPGPTLYPYQKNQLPPGAYGDPGGGGIPTSGLEQGKQLDANKPQQQRQGPTVYHRNYDKKGSTTVITGPNGTTVCTDSYGRRSATGVCW